MSCRIILALLCTLSFLSANSAVSELNGKVSASYGSEDSQDQSTVSGSVAGPLGDALGYQFDALYSSGEDLEQYGVGGHLFYRNEQGLIGLSAGGFTGDSFEAYELSIEMEYYLRWLTLGLRTGWASIDYDAGLIPAFIETKTDEAYAHVYATAYPLDDLAVTLSAEHRYDINYATLEVEYELPTNGLSLFVSGSTGENDYEQVNVGVRYYFGGEKTLKERHRLDDPRNVIRDIQRGAGVYRARVEKEREEFIEELIARIEACLEQNRANYVGLRYPFFYDPWLLDGRPDLFPIVDQTGDVIGGISNLPYMGYLCASDHNDLRYLPQQEITRLFGVSPTPILSRVPYYYDTSLIPYIPSGSSYVPVYGLIARDSLTFSSQPILNSFNSGYSAIDPALIFDIGTVTVVSGDNGYQP